MNPLCYRFPVRGGACLLLAASICVSIPALHAAEPPAPMSSTGTGVFVGTSFPTASAFQRFKDHEGWLGRPVDSILVYSATNSWKQWYTTINWTKTSMFGPADRRLVWSLPPFPAELGTDAWNVATSSMNEVRREAEAALLGGQAAVADRTWASTDPTLPAGPGGDTQNAVALKAEVQDESWWSSVQFNNAPAVAEFRVSYSATQSGQMYIMVNGQPKGSVSFAATDLVNPATETSPAKYNFKELRIAIPVAAGNSIKISNDSGSGFDVNYIAFGNFNEWYKAAAKTLVNFRPDDSVIFIRPAWEYNGNWYPWAAKNHENDYKVTFQRLVTAFREVSPNRFRFEWCSNFAHSFGGSTPADPELCYPGDAYVDVVSMDLYDSELHFESVGGPGPQNRWNFYTSPNTLRGLHWLREFAVKHNKLLAMGEWGVTGDNVPSNVIDENTYFVQQMQQWLADNRAIYHHYWDINDGYNGLLRPQCDGSFRAEDTANEYVFNFGTPIALTPGTYEPHEVEDGCWHTPVELTPPVFAPPSNTSDEFDKAVPRAQWKVLNHSPDNWSLTAKPGRLSFSSIAGTQPDNAFLQAAPDQDFEVVTRLYGKPTTNPQTAALIVYQDANNYVRLGRKFENSQNVFTFGKRVNGTFTSQSTADALGSPVYLKITRVGSDYRGYYSVDGLSWTQVWSQQNVALSKPRIGLACYGATGYTAEFDTFHVNKLEAEYGQLTGNATGSSTNRSGQKAVAWFDANGDAIEWKNVPGGSNLVIRYSSPYSGTKGLYIDGVRVQSINFASTGSNGTYVDLTVNRAIPAGARLKLQHDSGDTAWNVDYVTLSHDAKFEAEEAATEGTTERDTVVGSSNDGAVAIGASVWGAVKFTGLNAGGNLTLRYLWATGGSVRVDVNGFFDQDVTLPASSTFRDFPIDLVNSVSVNGSVKFSKNNGGDLVIDHLVVRP